MGACAVFDLLEQAFVCTLRRLTTHLGDHSKASKKDENGSYHEDIIALNTCVFLMS